MNETKKNILNLFAYMPPKISPNQIFLYARSPTHNQLYYMVGIVFNILACHGQSVQISLFIYFPIIMLNRLIVRHSAQQQHWSPKFVLHTTHSHKNNRNKKTTSALQFTFNFERRDDDYIVYSYTAWCL